MLYNETWRLLELYSGVEKGMPISYSKYARLMPTISDINCALESIDDPLFHLLEFYICRIPTHP